MKLANITSKLRSRIISQTFSRYFKGAKKVLDIGCGTGVVLYHLNNQYRFKTPIGCDIDKYIIYKIGFKKQKHISKLPFKNSQFDISMFNDVLHHTMYNNQENLIKEAMRVSKKILVFELKPTPINKFGDYFINKFHNPNMEIPYTYRSKTGWTNLYKKLKFKYKELPVKHPFFYPFRHIGFVIYR